MRLTFFVVLLIIFAFLVILGHAQDISELTTALQAGETEIRQGVMPAVVGILTAILLVAIAGSVVWVIVGRN